MFTTKQSDLFYNDETGDFVVCQVSAITAQRCEGSTDILSGAAPIVYKIDKDTNYKTLVYPESLNTFDVNNLFDLTPNCKSPATGFNTVTKPLINYNKAADRYSITFLGSYSTAVSGMSIMNYIFQPVDSKLKLLKSNVLVPSDSLKTTSLYTFDSGYLNSDLKIGGNSVRNGSKSFFENFERAPDYQIPPTHVEKNNTLGFNLLQHGTNFATDTLTGDKNFVTLHSGGYITYNSKYTSFDPNHTIRVEFTARSYNVPSMTAYGPAQTTEGAVSASRWVQQYSPAGAGEGFCVYFHDAICADVQPNGVGSTLGYASSELLQVETAGDYYPVSGLFIPVGDKYWAPGGNVGNVGIGTTGGNVGSNISIYNTGVIGSYTFEAATDKGLQYNTNGYLAESYLGVGFDITGEFSTTSDDKTGWYDGTSWTKKPSSVGIRGNRYFDTPVLTCVPLTSVAAASANPIWVDSTHASQDDAPFVDYRVDLSNKGDRLTVYNKATGDTSWKTILDFRLQSVKNATDGPYKRWGVKDGEDGKPRNLNVGLSFTTSTSASHFELKKFQVTGVTVKNPCEIKAQKVEEEEEENPEILTAHDYLNPFSKALRLNAASNVISSETNGRVNFSMVVPAKGFFRNQLFVERNKVRETLCDKPETEDEPIMVINAAGVHPDDLPGLITKVERGEDIGAIFTPRVLKTPEEREKDFIKLVKATEKAYGRYYGPDRVTTHEITHTIQVSEYKEMHQESGVSFEQSDLNENNNLKDQITTMDVKSLEEGGWKKGEDLPVDQGGTIVGGQMIELLGTVTQSQIGAGNTDLPQQLGTTWTLPDISLYQQQSSNDQIAASQVSDTGHVLWDAQKLVQLAQAQGADVSEIPTADLLTLSEATEATLGAGGEGMFVDHESEKGFDDWMAAFGKKVVDENGKETYVPIEATGKFNGVEKRYTGAVLRFNFIIPNTPNTPVQQSTTYTKNNLGCDLYIDLPNVWNNELSKLYRDSEWRIGSGGIVAKEAPEPRIYTGADTGNPTREEKFWIPDEPDYASSGNLHYIAVDGHTTGVIVPHTYEIGPKKMTAVTDAGFGMFVQLYLEGFRGGRSGTELNFIVPNGLRMYPDGFGGKKEKIGHVLVNIVIGNPSGDLG